MSFYKFKICFLLIKLFYLFFAFFVYSKFTSLGDTLGYLGGLHIERKGFPSSTFLMSLTGGFFSKLAFGTIFANIPLLLISYAGVIYPLSKFKNYLNGRDLNIIILFLSLPSIGVWSSIHSKESVVIFGLGVFLGFLIDRYESNRKLPNKLEVFGFFCFVLFKPHYLIPISCLMLYFLISSLINDSRFKVVVFIAHVIIAALVFYFFRDIISQYSFIMPSHFSLDSNTTRPSFWLDKYDVFFKAPLGMIIGFWGPTVSEVLERPIFFVFFFESFAIFLLFALYVINVLYIGANRGLLYLNSILGTIILVFWFLFVHYPFGVMNPGSALRYRESFYPFLLIFLYYNYCKVRIGRLNLVAQ